MTSRESFTAAWYRDDTRLVSDEGFILPELHDLLDLAAEAFLVDRSVRRGRVGEPGWTRDLRVAVPVRHPAVWARPEVDAAVTELLQWLTGDRWHVVPRPRADDREFVQARLPTADRPDCVTLFSGGLDATAGVAQLLARGRAVQAVGVVTNGAMSGFQKRVAKALHEAGRGRLTHVAVSLRSRQGTEKDEPTRRTRGLAFLSVGVASAVAAGVDRLLMLENGIGAINLPYTAAQWGPMTSRAAHPRTLRLMQELVSLLLDRPFVIENPHLGHTKGQMCAALGDWAEPACAASESCDYAAAGRGALDKRCGECTSCLLRRVSLHAAGRGGWDSRPYRSDIRGPRPERDRTWEMLWQVAGLDRALAGEDEALQSAFPALADVPEADLDTAAIRRLLRRYVDEWRHYPDSRVGRYIDVHAAEAALP